MFDGWENALKPMKIEASEEEYRDLQENLEICGKCEKNLALSDEKIYF